MPPPDFNDEETETLHRLVGAMKNPAHNGEHAAASELRRPRFDGTINLGHILTIVSGGLVVFTMFVNFRDTVKDLDSRVRILESNNARLSTTLEKISDNQSAIVRTQDRQTVLFEQLAGGKRP